MNLRQDQCIKHVSTIEHYDFEVIFSISSLSTAGKRIFSFDLSPFVLSHFVDLVILPSKLSIGLNSNYLLASWGTSQHTLM